jgi:hypothetical protein
MCTVSQLSNFVLTVEDLIVASILVRSDVTRRSPKQVPVLDRLTKSNSVLVGRLLSKNLPNEKHARTQFQHVGRHARKRFLVVTPVNPPATSATVHRVNSLFRLNVAADKVR